MIFSSVGDADNPKLSPKVEHFWAKADIEKYMAETLAGTTTQWSVFRPAAFMEGMDDVQFQNPLKKGSLKFLPHPSTPIKLISTKDIGKGAAAMFEQGPGVWAGRKFEAAACERTGNEMAATLSRVSGTKCTYSTMLPHWLLRLMLPEVYWMTHFFEQTGYSADVAEFRKLVPEAMDAEAWFQMKGQWSNGEKFASAKPKSQRRRGVGLFSSCASDYEPELPTAAAPAVQQAPPPADGVLR